MGSSAVNDVDKASAHPIVVIVKHTLFLSVHIHGTLSKYDCKGCAVQRKKRYQQQVFCKSLSNKNLRHIYFAFFVVFFAYANGC